MNLWDGKAAKTLNKLTNIVLLNLLWLLFSIPVITIVPATVAMAGVVKAWQLEEEERVFRPFMHFFVKNFRRSFFIGAMWLMVGAVLLVDLLLFLTIPHDLLRMVLITLTSFIILLYLFTSVYIIPVMLHENITELKPLLKRAFILSFYDLPVSFSVVLITSSAVVLVLLVSITSIFIGALTAMIVHRFSYRTFSKGKIMEGSQVNL
ncbi:DUF624 domain-containing protein [Alkalihalobacillus sp. MEB130]|uniref:DUF624 domain-containing protein n=1 Tax=Alkalihalobacillus sp. MEB130 TaxID=2976704 RepID=UPI0028E05891|nr:DUF624 domain-containing protein [Alkalihalobacillus sp. MEB130]MDT8860755.1 DUF624 domain-containing protein [Alkalihalobacillus sp. MEB130]